jgi:hypothetical protein
VLKKEQISVRVAQQAQQVLKLRRQLPVLHSSSKTCRRYLKAYRSFHKNLPGMFPPLQK